MLSTIDVGYMVYEVSEGAPAIPSLGHLLIMGWWRLNITMPLEETMGLEDKQLDSLFQRTLGPKTLDYFQKSLGW